MGLFISSVVAESWQGLGAQESGTSRGPLPLLVEGAFSPRGKGREIMDSHRRGSQVYLWHSRGQTEGGLDGSPGQGAHHGRQGALLSGTWVQSHLPGPGL